MDCKRRGTARIPNSVQTQPSGRRFFLAQTSLLTPYRPLKGMRVARASSGPKIPRRKRGRIYETGYLVSIGVAGGVLVGLGISRVLFKAGDGKMPKPAEGDAG